MDNSLLSKGMAYQIAHADINIINLDKTEDESDFSIEGIRQSFIPDVLDPNKADQQENE